ncbi:MAG: hypothetical protein ACMZ64_06700 [Oleiphilus sp.]
MSKSAKDLLQEFQPENGIEDDFSVHILQVKVDENGEVEQSGNALSVVKVEIDHKNRECLLHFEENTSNPVTVSEIKSKFITEILDYEVCAAQEKTIEDSYVRLDTPLIGFGENFELKYFLAVCQA